MLARILGTQDGDPALDSAWRVGSAYDLGSILIATLERDGDAQAITALSVAPQPGFTAETLEAAFAGGPDTGRSHPLEVLGYDLVQPQGASLAEVGARKLPRLDYAWMRVDPDSGERENGAGSAIWLRCEEDQPAIDGRLVLLSAERAAGKYDATRLVGFANRLPICNVR